MGIENTTTKTNERRFKNTIIKIDRKGLDKMLDFFEKEENIK